MSSITPFKNSDDQKTPEKPINTEKPSMKTLEKFVTQYKLNLSPKLTTEQRYKLMNVLYQNRDVFAKDISEIKKKPTKTMN